MRKVITFIIFLIIIFITNLIFYYLSEDYRLFLKGIKNKNHVVYLEEEEYNDVIKIDNDTGLIEKIEDNYLYHEENIKEDFFVLDKKDENSIENEVVLGKNYMEVLNLFSIYELNKLELNSSLFDITDEYPDNYYEYYSKDLTLYFFTTKDYHHLYDIFTLLGEDLPFSIKEVNNFGDKSFYINLDKDIEDRFIRVIISNKGITFGLKIKRNEYNLVREKLNSLREL